MLIFLVVLFGYLITLKKWGKSLQAKNTTQGRRRIYGVASAVPLLVVALYAGGGGFVFALCAAPGLLCYITVVYVPWWMVDSWGILEITMRCPASNWRVAHPLAHFPVGGVGSLLPSLGR